MSFTDRPRTSRPAARRGGALLLLMCLVMATGHVQARSRAQAPEGCGQSRQTYGPFDYRTATPPQREIVEDAHFTPQVESLVAGMTGPVAGDISYTLGVFPNHHRALISMTRLAERLKVDPIPRMEMSPECYFLRAIRFVPDDLVLRMLYASYLIMKQRVPDAEKVLVQVASLAADNPFTLFNIGMLYMDAGNHEQARAFAWRAEALGLKRMELRQRLGAVGQWREPPEAAQDAASAAGNTAMPAAGPASAAASGPNGSLP